MPSDASPDSFPLSSVRTIALVGLMGVGKSTVGRRLAARLGLPFARALMKQHAVSVWMRADLKVIAERVGRRDTRPLLRNRDPLTALNDLAKARYPIYGEADLTVDVGGGSHAQAVEAILKQLRRFGRQETQS